jgi:rhodanese-related sulfurtransferase
VSVYEIDVDELEGHHAAGAVVIDVREPHEYDEAHVPGALLIPMGEVQERVGDFRQTAPIYLICATGSRSRRVAEFLETQGIEAINVVGGTTAWIDAGFPVDQGGAG